MTTFLADYGIVAVFVLMFVDAFFPAASELVMVYGGALASATGIHWFRSLGESVTIVTGVIFIACVLAFRRGIVGEIVARVRPLRA